VLPDGGRPSNGALIAPEGYVAEPSPPPHLSIPHPPPPPIPPPPPLSPQTSSTRCSRPPVGAVRRSDPSQPLGNSALPSAIRPCLPPPSSRCVGPPNNAPPPQPSSCLFISGLLVGRQTKLSPIFLGHHIEGVGLCVVLPSLMAGRSQKVFKISGFPPFFPTQAHRRDSMGTKRAAEEGKGPTSSPTQRPEGWSESRVLQKFAYARLRARKQITLV